MRYSIPPWDIMSTSQGFHCVLRHSASQTTTLLMPGTVSFCSITVPCPSPSDLSLSILFQDIASWLHFFQDKSGAPSIQRTPLFAQWFLPVWHSIPTMSNSCISVASVGKAFCPAHGHVITRLCMISGSYRSSNNGSRSLPWDWSCPHARDTWPF